MARVELAATAVEDLGRMIGELGLPGDARHRVRRALRALEDFPLAGRALEGDWAAYRFWLGPWPWMIFVYELDSESATVSVVTIQDARSATTAR